MFINFDDFQHFGVQRFEKVTATAASTSKGLQAIAAEAMDYSNKCLDSNRAFGEKLLQTKPQDFVELQSQFAKAAYDEFVARVTKISKLYSELVKEAFEELSRDAFKPLKSAPPAPAQPAVTTTASKARITEKQN